MSSFGASAEASCKIIYMCVLIVLPLCSIGLRGPCNFQRLPAASRGSKPLPEVFANSLGSFNFQRVPAASRGSLQLPGGPCSFQGVSTASKAFLPLPGGPFLFRGGEGGGPCRFNGSLSLPEGPCCFQRVPAAFWGFKPLPRGPCCFYGVLARSCNILEAPAAFMVPAYSCHFQGVHAVFGVPCSFHLVPAASRRSLQLPGGLCHFQGIPATSRESLLLIRGPCCSQGVLTPSSGSLSPRGSLLLFWGFISCP